MPSITINGVIPALCIIFYLYFMTPKYETLPGAYGFTSTIYKLPGPPPRICKSMNPDCVETHFPVEKEAYERFNSSSPPIGILKYHGIHDTIPAGLILEYAEKGNLKDYIWMVKEKVEPKPTKQLLFRWAIQATEALEFAHGLGVYNSDIHCVNFFLTADLDLKVGDWAGASIDGGRSYSSYRYRHRLFDTDGTDIASNGITAQTEVFAMGSALYYMVMGQEVWPELEEPEDRQEIKKRISERQWPDLGGLEVLRDVVLGCWNVEFGSMKEVRLAVLAEMGRVFGEGEREARVDRGRWGAVSEEELLGSTV